jgi:hypothetical protein
MQRVDPAQTISELDLLELGIARLAFHPPEISRPLNGVGDGFGFRYGYVEDFTVVLYDEEADVAGQLNLEIEQGATFTHTFYWENRDGTPVDLTGATALMQIRAEKSTSADHKASIASYAYPVSGPTPWFDAITITELEGKLVVYLNPTDTSQIEAGEWWYDTLITFTTGEVFRLTEGRMVVDPGVTTP